MSTTAQAYASFVIGRHNTIAGSTGGWLSNDPLFVAGNGGSINFRSNALVLYKNGNLTIAGTLTQSSDARLKEDLRPLQDVLSRLEQLQPTYYRFRQGTSRSRARQIGLIAQEVEAVFPELVSREADGYLSVSYSNLSAVLVQAINEQQQEIARLEAELSALRTGMETRLAQVELLLAAPPAPAPAPMRTAALSTRSGH